MPRGEKRREASQRSTLLPREWWKSSRRKKGRKKGRKKKRKKKKKKMYTRLYGWRTLNFNTQPLSELAKAGVMAIRAWL